MIYTCHHTKFAYQILNKLSIKGVRHTQIRVQTRRLNIAVSSMNKHLLCIYYVPDMYTSENTNINNSWFFLEKSIPQNLLCDQFYVTIDFKYSLTIIVLHFVHSEVSVIFEKMYYQKTHEIKCLYSFLSTNKNHVYYIHTDVYIHMYIN